jgi:uncharacterized membrane protein YcgQ (UPF0703/DUF1980 family)
MLIKIILKISLYVFASISFFSLLYLGHLVFWASDTGSKHLTDITIRQFCIILCWLVSAYILTTFLKSSTTEKENKPQ